ncbi:MAG: LysM peptidoglycan-binding domain-containing protein [Nevskia sp.]|nr:LysM peptidoglycan-binding domain-containing protein [Nevskia sp.]
MAAASARIVLAAADPPATAPTLTLDERLTAVPADAPQTAPRTAAPPASAAAAASADSVAADDPRFPHLAVLAPQVAFWTRVFAEYSENQSVVHSTEDVRKIYTVLDFRSQAATLDAPALEALRQREEKRARARIDELLARVDALKNTPQKMDAEERRVYQMYADSDDPQRFRRAIGTFRVQRGLRERTERALITAGRYWPAMERIFAAYGLPTRLTRLPLVESSFDLDAYSKVGAAGLWQFIPSSARLYMRLDEIADQRRDPWFSTDAAARHLRDDYDALQDWPLAITAYNYGRGGLRRALEKIGGHSLADLLERYDDPRFGFASRNFYAEFLAACDVARDAKKYFGPLPQETPLSFETVETRDYVPYATLRRLSGADPGTFRELNPSFSEAVVDGRLYVPPGQLIRVPADAAEQFKQAYLALGDDQRFDRQRAYYVAYRVERGDSLGKLARRYGVSVAAIQAANDLKQATRLRAGQTIKIPPREAPVLAHAEPASPHAMKVAARASGANPAAVRLHRVRPGQTLSEIAERYRTTVHRLRELNHLEDADFLRVGSLLKIPRQ